MTTTVRYSRIKWWAGLLSISLVAIGILLSQVLVFAARDDSLGAQISPVTSDIKVDPGKSYATKVTITNVTNHALELTPAVYDFTAKDETGTPKILLEGTAPTSASLKSWVTFADPMPFQLSPKKSRVLHISINVPVNADAGGHYGFVGVKGGDAIAGSKQVALKGSVGMLVFLRVSGNITEKLSLKDFFTSSGDHKTSLFASGPVNFTERIHNDGNIHVRPQGDITITDMFGKQVGSVGVNSDAGNVLPKTTRRFQQKFDKPHMFGKYTATFHLAYGSHGQVLSGTLKFWVIPFKTIALFLLIFILAIYLFIKSIKGYNKRVIRKALSKKNHKD